VNVHPTKLEVRFRDGRQLYSHLLGTIRSMFLSTDLTARVDDAGKDLQGPEAAMDPGKLSQHRQQLVDWTQGSSGSEGVAEPGALGNRVGAGMQWQPSENAFAAPAGSHVLVSGNTGQQGQPSEALSDTVTGSSLGMQLHNRYLVTEHENGIMVIDQHALHERILYEQLREKISNGAMEVQRLLVPEPVNLTAAEAAAVVEATEELAALGIEVEPFGGDTVIVLGYPAMLGKLSPEEILRQVVEQLMAKDRPPERRDLIDELLHSMSCRAAVKAGDSLAIEEVVSLLLQRDLCQDSHHCPHGRPTALVFTKDELDRRFRRI